MKARLRLEAGSCVQMSSAHAARLWGFCGLRLETEFSNHIRQSLDLEHSSNHIVAFVLEGIFLRLVTGTLRSMDTGHGKS